MEQIELRREEFIILPMFAHEGEKSLDALATKFYGKTYCGQQTGEMIANDSYMVYDMRTEGDVEDYHPEDCYKPLSRWLSMKIGDTVEDTDRWPYGQKTITYESQIEREAPLPSYVLADLIRNGVLPYGKYLVRVWW